MYRRTKIIATIGPASQGAEVLENLMRAGMNVARMNFSHGTHEEHAQRIQTVREVSARLGVYVAILQDLQGPKIRVGQMEQPLQLAEGQKVQLYAEGDPAPSASLRAVPVDFPELFESCHAGNKLLLDDGRLALDVETCGQRQITARVAVGGMLSSHKGINLPGVHINVSGFTPKDQEDLIFGLGQGVDAVAISFVRSAEDVRRVRDAIQSRIGEGRAPLLIAKLEKPEALDELDRILDLADGVMVARGDLGVEMPPEKVPAVQKRIIRAANAHAKTVITATQMLESMIHNPLPTRAEASDVANAIFDGTDVVMLSGETAVGEYPVESVALMDRIAREAESNLREWGKRSDLESLGNSDAASMVRAAFELGMDRDVAAIAIFTMQGQTGLLMSKTHPVVPILGFTPDESTCRRLAFDWGVIPTLVPFADTVEDMLQLVDAAMQESEIVEPGQQVVLIFGFPLGAMRSPNMALLHTVGSGRETGDG